MIPRPDFSGTCPGVRPTVMLAAAVVLLSAVRAAPAQTSAGQDAGVRVREAEVALRTGRYQEATSAFRRLVRQGEAYPVADRGLVRSLAAIGRYEEAEEAARASVAQHAGSAELQRVLGDVLVKRGDLEGAAAAYRAAVGGGASDRLSAELGQAMLLYDRGARDEALRRFEGMPNPTADDLTSVALGLSYLGGRDPDFLRDALRVYDEAIAADPGYQRPRVLLGELFLAKYNSLDAGPMFQDVLQANPDHADALLGMARRAQFDGSSEALDLVRRSLGTNPNHVAARAFLSRLLLDLGDTRGAEEEAQRALEVNPNSLEALSILAAALHVRGDQTGYETVRQRALEINPRYADLFTTVGEVAVRNHLYRDAVTFGRRAVEQDPFSWSAYGLLGLNLLRTGEVEEGRAVLEASFAGDPFNPWVKNTLDLLDNLAGFDEVRSDRFRFFMDSGESEILSVYLPGLAEEAFSALAARYPVPPDTPVRLEVFSRHADFSVRTVGLAGFGALGVSFGNVLAMDSPSARGPGEFNWGSTLWHELSHAFTLAATAHRIPRWLTEGLAVYDERLARQGWGSDATPDFLMAYKEDRLRSVAELNYGFIRPAYPGQIIHSYYQASLVCEMIEEEEGHGAILALLNGYRDGLSSDEVFARALGTDLESFDRRFRAYLDTRFAVPLAALSASGNHGARQGAQTGDLAGSSEPAPGDFTGQLAHGIRLFQAGSPEQARPYLERAKGLFPSYAGADSPYLVLARLHSEAGDVQDAIGELEAFTAINENHYAALLELAELHESVADQAAAVHALERAIYVWPFEAELHERLATHAAELNRPELEIRERTALLALDPVDRAGAFYQLAMAYYRSGDARAARRTVLRALEIAPNYPEAQDLLLRLRSERAPGDGGGTR